MQVGAQAERLAMVKHAENSIGGEEGNCSGPAVLGSLGSGAAPAKEDQHQHKPGNATEEEMNACGLVFLDELTSEESLAHQRSQHASELRQDDTRNPSGWQRTLRFCSS